jgi:Uma2 family endonuclease
MSLMTLAQPIRSRATPQEYLRYEYDAEERHEWRDGEVVAMAGGSPDHSLVIANFIGTLHGRLRGSPCRVYDSNLRVRDRRTTLYTYPDLTVICGEREFDPKDERRQTVLNPTVLIEVVSPSSEGDDRGEKFNRYRDIPSLQEYVLVSQVMPQIQTFLRQPEGAWLLRVYEGMDAKAQLASLNVEVPLGEVYAGVEFPVASESRAAE